MSYLIKPNIFTNDNLNVLGSVYINSYFNHEHEWIESHAYVLECKKSKNKMMVQITKNNEDQYKLMIEDQYCVLGRNMDFDKFYSSEGAVLYHAMDFVNNIKHLDFDKEISSYTNHVSLMINNYCNLMHVDTTKIHISR